MLLKGFRIHIVKKIQPKLRAAVNMPEGNNFQRRFQILQHHCGYYEASQGDCFECDYGH